MSRRAAFCLVSLAVAVAAIPKGRSSENEPFEPWKRVSDTPILSPRASGWESAGTFNPTVILRDDKIVMLYRAQDAAGTSRIGYAESDDGIQFTRRADPVLSPDTAYEAGGGVEDPRLQTIDGTYYLTYTGYNKKDAQLCLATIVPAYKGNWNVGWTKSGAMVPSKIVGKYWMYWLGTAADKTDQMGLSFSTDLLHWTEATNTPVLGRRAGSFDSRVVEPGPAPIITPRGIVLIYNGADEHLVYRTGVAIFDSNDPPKLLYRSDQPIFEPVWDWEKVGQVPNVVFVEGMVEVSARGNAKSSRKEWRMYYGAADKYVGVAETEMGN